MRLSEFHRLMAEEFGSARAEVISDTLVLPTLGSTAREALDAGTDPRTVWLDVCELQGVPAERRLGRDIPPKDTPA